MAGIQLSALVDLFLGTSQAVLTGANFIRNETQPRNSFLRQVMKAHDMESMLQGGDTITDQVIFDSDSTYGPYNILEPKQTRLSNHLTEISVGWAFTDASVMFSKHEKGLNNASQLNKGARAFVFKNIIKAKWSNLFVSINRGMENEFFAQPNVATMETVTTGTRVPYSLFVTIHEFGALTASPNPTATVPPGFTVIQTINPTTQPLWRSPVEFYADGKAEIAGPSNAQTSAANPGGTPQGWDGFAAFQAITDRLKFEELAIRPEYGEPTDPEAFWITSKKGKALYIYAMQRSGDFLRNAPLSGNYPGLAAGITFDGAPIKWLESMDTADVWSDAAGTGFAGENDDTLDINGVSAGVPLFQGPRFVAVVPKYYKKIVHSEHFLEEETPPATAENPYVRQVFFDCWHQNFCHSRLRAGGVVTPRADIDGFSAAGV